MVRVRAIASSASVSLASLEMPKSSTFTEAEPSAALVRKRLAGLRSRWTMPTVCASAMASQAWSR